MKPSFWKKMLISHENSKISKNNLNCQKTSIFWVVKNNIFHKNYDNSIPLFNKYIFNFSSQNSLKFFFRNPRIFLRYFFSLMSSEISEFSSDFQSFFWEVFSLFVYCVLVLYDLFYHFFFFVSIASSF